MQISSQSLNVKYQFQSSKYSELCNISVLVLSTQNYAKRSLIPDQALPNNFKHTKSNLHFVKNLLKRSKSTIKVSNQNTPPSKLVQKSIFKFPSCSSYSPHQNLIKIMPKIIQKPIQKLKFPFGTLCKKCN